MNQAARVLVFRNSAGEEISAPGEWMPAWIEIVGASPDAWREVSLSIQNQPCEVLPRCLPGESTPRLLAQWPRAGTGHYHLQWKIGEDSGARSITINSQKISSAAYSHLLEDLETRLPASLAIALQSVGGLGGVYFLPPSQSTLAQEWDRLQRAARGHNARPGLIEVLRVLVTDPHRVLATREMWTPTLRARRPLPSRLGMAVARPGNVQLLENDGEYSGSWRLRRVVDARVEETFDVYENRLVKGFYEQVQRRLRRLNARLKQTTSHAEIAQRAEELAHELHQARRAISA